VRPASSARQHQRPAAEWAREEPDQQSGHPYRWSVRTCVQCSRAWSM
jgi:hypothetical protein